MTNVVGEGGIADGLGATLLEMRQQLDLAPAVLPSLTGDRSPLPLSAPTSGSLARPRSSNAALYGCYGVPLVEVLTGHRALFGTTTLTTVTAAAADEAGHGVEDQGAAVVRRIDNLVVASRIGVEPNLRVSPPHQAPGTGRPRVRHGDFEVLAVVLDTSPRCGCDNWPCRALPVSQPLRPT